MYIHTSNFVLNIIVNVCAERPLALGHRCSTWHTFEQTDILVLLNLTDDFIRHPVPVCPTSKDNTVICNSLASHATVLIVAARDKWRVAIPSSTIYASTGTIGHRWHA